MARYGAHKYYRDEGIVLRTQKLGEADRIITLLTREHGRVRVVAKGVRKTTSRIGARLEPFNHVDLQVTRSRSLDIVAQVVTIAPYAHLIMHDYPLYTNAALLAELVERLTPAEEERSSTLFRLTIGAFDALSRRRHPSDLVAMSFMLRALALAGWAPSFSDCAGCGQTGPHAAFSVAEGGAVCEECRAGEAIVPNPLVLELLGNLLAADWSAIYEQVGDSSQTLNSSEGQGLPAGFRQDAWNLANRYTQWHLERRLRSIPLVMH